MRAGTRRAVSSEFKCKALDRELAQALLAKSYGAGSDGDDGNDDAVSFCIDDGRDVLWYFFHFLARRKDEQEEERK